MSARPRLTFVAALATLLAALSLSSTFQDGNWFWPVVASIAAAAVGCGLGRRIGLPRPVVPLLGLAAVTITVTWLNARDVAVLGLIPGPGALRVLDDLVRSGFEGMRKYATPAPTDPGLVLIAAAGAGLVAVVVDALAVTYRSAAMAGVPLLLLYAVPLTVVRGGVPVLLFIAAAIGWLALMLAEGRERLAGWGRALGRRSTKDDDPLTHTPPEPLGVVGRRIGAAAVGLALIVPALMPWAGSSLFKSSGGGTGVNGSGLGGPVSALNPVDELGGFLTRKSEVTLMKYTTTDPDADYFRVITLDNFDGSKWKPAAQRIAGDVGQLPASAPDIAGTEVSTTVRILGLNQDWLPVTYPGGSIAGLTGRWSYDATTLDVFSNGASTTRGQTYTVHSRHLAPTAAELRAAGPPSPDIQDAYTQLPDNIPSSVLAKTNQIIAGKTTAYDKALALQAFFIDPVNKFKYTTTPVFTGNPLVSFLTNRAGFCQQFAGAFAVMARQAHLPTRVEIGFTPGSAPDSNGLRSVTNHNAHAWPEVYFYGIGWVRFEPTASAPAGVVQPAWAPGPNGSGPIIDRGQNNGGVPFDKLHEGFNRGSGGDVPANPFAPKTPSATVEPATFPWALLLGGIAIVVMLLPATARVVRRRRRLRPGRAVDVDTARETVRLAWLELADTARDLRGPVAGRQDPAAHRRLDHRVRRRRRGVGGRGPAGPRRRTVAVRADRRRRALGQRPGRGREGRGAGHGGAGLEPRAVAGAVHPGVRARRGVRAVRRRPGLDRRSRCAAARPGAASVRPTRGGGRRLTRRRRLSGRRPRDDGASAPRGGPSSSASAPWTCSCGRAHPTAGPRSPRRAQARAATS